MSLASLVAATYFARVFCAYAFPVLAFAASSAGIELFDPRGNRADSAVVEGDRVDLFDVHSNRTGSSRVEDGRRVDFFDTRSNRPGSGRIRDGVVEKFET